MLTTLHFSFWWNIFSALLLIHHLIKLIFTKFGLIVWWRLMLNRLQLVLLDEYTSEELKDFVLWLLLYTHLRESFIDLLSKLPCKLHFTPNNGRDFDNFKCLDIFIFLLRMFELDIAGRHNDQIQRSLDFLCILLIKFEICNRLFLKQGHIKRMNFDFLIENRVYEFNNARYLFRFCIFSLRALIIFRANFLLFRLYLFKS